MSTDLKPGRPMPTHTIVYPPVTRRSQELAQAFREAVSLAHQYGVDHPRNFAPPHRDVEDADYNCDHPWCQRFWAMVREAEAEARKP